MRRQIIIKDTENGMGLTNHQLKLVTDIDLVLYPGITSVLVPFKFEIISGSDITLILNTSTILLDQNVAICNGYARYKNEIQLYLFSANETKIEKGTTIGFAALAEPVQYRQESLPKEQPKTKKKRSK